MTAAPVVAIADDTTATNGQTGTGTTELTIQVNNDGPHSGTDDPTNPDEDGDGLGDVIAFTVPSKVNFVVKSNGELIAPSAEQTYIENRSNFAIYTSHLIANESSPWHVVADAAAVINDGSTLSQNNVDVQITPNSSEQKVNIADYLRATEKELDAYKLGGTTQNNKWNVSPSVDGDAIITDRVNLGFDGDVSNVTIDITKPAKFAELNWYVTPGALSTNS